MIADNRTDCQGDAVARVCLFVSKISRKVMVWENVRTEGRLLWNMDDTLMRCYILSLQTTVTFVLLAYFLVAVPSIARYPKE